MHSICLYGDTNQNKWENADGLGEAVMKSISMHRAQPITKHTPADAEQDIRKTKITAQLEANIAWVQQYFVRCSDLVIRRFLIGAPNHEINDEQNSCQAVLLYLDGMTDNLVVHEHILNALMRPVIIDAVSKMEVSQKQEKLCCQKTAADQQTTYQIRTEQFDYLSFLMTRFLTAGEVTLADTLEDGVLAMMHGDVFLLLQGSTEGLILDAKGFPHRELGEPQKEKVLYGPQEAFVETIRINTALIRRRLHTNQLKIEQLTLGQLTQTQVAIVYLEHLANANIIAEVRRRLNNVKQVDSILNASCIEQYIEDRPFSIFPQVQYTERPDKTTAALLEGRVALIVDGSPDVMLLPVLFTQLLQSPEDYYNRVIPGTFLRWIRYIGLWIATTLPSLYVAITSFHPELIPFNLLLSITTAREGVPFPAFVEALAMELAFELLREASIRMPGAIGNTIGIVGALVIGEAAVSAHLVAPQMVIVVAITAIGSFAIPSVEASYPIRLIRFPLMILAAIFGLYGVMLGWMAIILYLIQMRTFGFPYLQPLAPCKNGELLALAVRMPRWQMMKKPLFHADASLAEKNCSSKDTWYTFFQRTIQPLKQRGDESRGQ